MIKACISFAFYGYYVLCEELFHSCLETSLTFISQSSRSKTEEDTEADVSRMGFMSVDGCYGMDAMF